MRWKFLATFTKISVGIPSFLRVHVNGKRNNSITYYIMNNMASNEIEGVSLLPLGKWEKHSTTYYMMNIMASSGIGGVSLLL